MITKLLVICLLMVTISTMSLEVVEGGGVAILIRSALPVKVNNIFEARSFESIHVTIQAKSICLQVVTIYRVPPSTKNKIKSSEFLPEFTGYLEQLAPLKGKLLIAGDINIKWNLLHDPERKSFADILDTNNLIQHVSALIPTHDKGNTIDMIISREGDDLVQSCQVSSQISDHNAVHAILRK